MDHAQSYFMVRHRLRRILGISTTSDFILRGINTRRSSSTNSALYFGSFSSNHGRLDGQAYEYDQIDLGNVRLQIEWDVCSQTHTATDTSRTSRNKFRLSQRIGIFSHLYRISGGVDGVGIGSDGPCRGVGFLETFFYAIILSFAEDIPKHVERAGTRSKSVDIWGAIITTLAGSAI